MNFLVLEGFSVKMLDVCGDDYICLTDMCKGFKSKDIDHWGRSRSTYEFLHEWESLYNTSYKYRGISFESLLSQVFPKIGVDPSSGVIFSSISEFIRLTGALGIAVIKKGSNAVRGVYAHKDIAFKFAFYLSQRFELLVIKEYQEYKNIGVSYNVPKYVQRYRLNAGRVSPGYKSVIQIFYDVVYRQLEIMGCVVPDNRLIGENEIVEIRPDISVGKFLAKYMRDNGLNEEWGLCSYEHLLPNGIIVKANQIRTRYSGYVEELILTDWLLDANGGLRYMLERFPECAFYLQRLNPLITDDLIRVAFGNCSFKLLK